MITLFIKRLSLYAQLMRLHKPIGIYLLLWPTYWALWLANLKTPSIKLLCIFTAGVVLMRSAGCVLNDIADRHIDRHVERTKNRPLANDTISLKASYWLACLLLLFSLLLLLMLHPLTWFVAIAALLGVITYPYTKRFFSAPQICLGIVFSINIPMAFVAVCHTVSPIGWLLFMANLLWIIAYDTQYGMADKKDDLRLRLKSTAITFGRYDLFIIGLLQAGFLGIMSLIGVCLGFNIAYWIAWIGVGCLFCYQHYLTFQRNPKDAFRAFLTNHWAGLLFFIGILLQR